MIMMPSMLFLHELKDDLDIPGFDEEILQSMMADTENITNSISDFGKLSSEEAADVVAAGERKQEAINTAKAETSQDGPLQQPEAQPVNSSIVCPNCGVTICL